MKKKNIWFQQTCIWNERSYLFFPKATYWKLLLEETILEKRPWVPADERSRANAAPTKNWITKQCKLMRSRNAVRKPALCDWVKLRCCCVSVWTLWMLLKMIHKSYKLSVTYQYMRALSYRPGDFAASPAFEGQRSTPEACLIFLWVSFQPQYGCSGFLLLR